MDHIIATGNRIIATVMGATLLGGAIGDSITTGLIIYVFAVVGGILGLALALTGINREKNHAQS